MNQKYKYIKKIPHGDKFFSVPISGLFTELLDQQKMFFTVKQKQFFPINKLSIKEKHKEACERIATCVGYLSTISHRLLNKSDNGLFLSKQLDWECIRIYSQVMLDSLAVLVPSFYGISSKYQEKCPFCNRTRNNTVSSFNNLNDWFVKHKLNDKLTRKYRLIKKQYHWYKLLNVDRTNFIHKSITPMILSKKTAQELGLSSKIKKDKLMNFCNHKPSKIMKINTIEKESKKILKNLFELLAFSNYFFVEKLKEKKIIVSKNNQYKYILRGNFRDFNKLVF